MADDIESLSGDISPMSDASLLLSPRSQHMDIKHRLMSLNLSGSNEWFQRRRQNIRPWTVFLGTSRFSSPTTATILPQRIARNLDYFQSNYVFVFIGLVFYCFITSPLLLLTVAATAGACYIVRLKNQNQKISILGHEVTVVQQYGLVIICAMPFFMFAGAGSAVFWIIGASFVLIMCHASFFAIETLKLPEDEMGFPIPMQTV